MLRSVFSASVRVAGARQLSSGKDLPVSQHSDAKKKEIEDILYDVEPKVSPFKIFCSLNQCCDAHNCCFEILSQIVRSGV